MPTAALLLPVLLDLSAEVPIAMLPLPVVSAAKADPPIAVLFTPVVKAFNADAPTAVLSVPVVVAFPANPTNTFSLERLPKANAVLPMSKLFALTDPATSRIDPD
jgi:hypothetical protein